jgi:hypothetical protein
MRLEAQRLYRLPDGRDAVALKLGQAERWVLWPERPASSPASQGLTFHLQDLLGQVLLVNEDGRLKRLVMKFARARSMELVPPVSREQGTPAHEVTSHPFQAKWEDTGWTVSDLADTGEDRPDA